MATVDDLNEGLAGSPYLLNDDAAGTARAQFLQSEMDDIVKRHYDVEEAFSVASKDARERLQALTGARFVFESNALELTGLPLDQTQREIANAPRDFDQLAKYLAEKAITADRQLIDVLGLHRANLFVGRLAHEYRASAPIHEVDIRSLHAATVPTERFAGRYRDIEVQIAGSTHTPPPAFEVPRQMRELVDWLNGTQSPAPLAATVVHSWLTIVHPFQDGNGRVARLLANLVLLRSGWPSLIVRASDRLQYLDALSASDEAGDLLPLFDLFIKSIKRSLKELGRPGLAERLFDADLRQNPNMRYEIWSGMLTRFLDSLRASLTPLGFDLYRLAVPNVSTFMLLCEGDSSGNTWLAKLRHSDGRDYLLWLGYMTHEMKDYGGPDGPTPSIFVSERDRSGQGMHPYVNPMIHGSPIEIDELSLVPTVQNRSSLIRFAKYSIDTCTVDEAAHRLTEAVVAARKGMRDHG